MTNTMIRCRFLGVKQIISCCHGVYPVRHAGSRDANKRNCGSPKQSGNSDQITRCVARVAFSMIKHWKDRPPCLCLCLCFCVCVFISLSVSVPTPACPWARCGSTPTLCVTPRCPPADTRTAAPVPTGDRR